VPCLRANESINKTGGRLRKSSFAGRKYGKGGTCRCGKSLQKKEERTGFPDGGICRRLRGSERRELCRAGLFGTLKEKVAGGGSLYNQSRKKEPVNPKTLERKLNLENAPDWTGCSRVRGKTE